MEEVKFVLDVCMSFWVCTNHNSKDFVFINCLIIVSKLSKNLIHYLYKSDNKKLPGPGHGCLK